MDHAREGWRAQVPRVSQGLVYYLCVSRCILKEKPSRTIWYHLAAVCETEACFREGPVDTKNPWSNHGPFSLGFISHGIHSLDSPKELPMKQKQTSGVGAVGP